MPYMDAGVCANRDAAPTTEEKGRDDPVQLQISYTTPKRSAAH